MQNFNFDKLNKTYHMLKWLADDPYKEIINNVTKMLNQHVEGTKLLLFEVTSDPDWLTGLTDAVNVEHKVVTRVGCAFECSLEVNAEGVLHQLTGVYTWVGNNLQDPPNIEQQVWLDLGKTLETKGSNAELMTRIYL